MTPPIPAQAARPVAVALPTRATVAAIRAMAAIPPQVTSAAQHAAAAVGFASVFVLGLSNDKLLMLYSCFQQSQNTALEWLIWLANFRSLLSSTYVQLP